MSPIPPVLTGHIIAAEPVQTNLSPFVTLSNKKKGSLSIGANARQRECSKKTVRTLPGACPIRWVGSRGSVLAKPGHPTMQQGGHSFLKVAKPQKVVISR